MAVIQDKHGLRTQLWIWATVFAWVFLPACRHVGTAGLGEGYLYQRLLPREQSVTFRLLKDEYELRVAFDPTRHHSCFGPMPSEWPDVILCCTERGDTEVIQRIHDYDSLRHLVNLESPADAMEFFRFFSGDDVWKYTPRWEFEVYPDDSLPVQEWEERPWDSRVPGSVWDAASLPRPSAVADNDGYQVKRFVVVEGKIGERMRLYEVVDYIGYDGDGYKRSLWQEVVPAPTFVGDIVLPYERF